MTTAGEPHEVIVDQRLADELERVGVRGVHIGDRVRLQVIHAEARARDVELPSWIGSFDGPPDLVARSSEILWAEFPEGRF
jgi:hypothetical protein